MATAEIRLKRAEQDIETLRSTQSAILERVDSFEEMLTESRDITRDNQRRLERLEEVVRDNHRRLELLEEVVLENRSIILDNRRILLAIADHLDLTMEMPPQDPQSD